MSSLLTKYFNKDIQLIIAASGIYLSYLYFGVLQEHIYTSPTREPFKFPEFVVFSQMILGFLISGFMLLIFPSPIHPNLYLKTKILYGASFSYSMFLTNFSLTLISYPTQALAKSCKILPVMLGSLFVKGVKYHPLQYLSVLMITAGVIIFNFKGKGFGSDSLFGLLALLGSLFLDGFTSYYAEFFRRNIKTSSLKNLNNCCLYGAILLIPLVFTIDIYLPDKTVIDYIIKHPDILYDIIIFSATSAFGQLFIFWALNLSGSVTLAIITTTRKFLTVLLSILWFTHSISTTQMFSMLLVFSGAFIDMAVTHTGKKTSHKD